MPIVDLETPGLSSPTDTPKGFAVTPGALDLDQSVERPAWSETFGAAFRHDNTVASYRAADASAAPSRADPEFGSAWDKIKGTKYEAHWDRFVDVRNSKHFEAVRQDIDQEEEDRKTLDAAGWRGFVASLIAGTVDLPTLLPGGALIRSTRGGVSIGRSAVSVGIAAGVGASASELALQATQQTRTMRESIENVGGAILLGGLLGTAGGALLSRTDWNRSVAALNDQIATPPVDPVQVNTALSPAGAEVVRPPDLEALSIAGGAAEAVAGGTRFLNPALRRLHSPSPVARDVATQLFENSLYLKGNLEGIASHTSAETLVKEWNAGLAQAVSHMSDAFERYAKAGGPMRYEEFRRAVGRAMREGDEDAVPEVAAVAKAWRQDVFDPLKDEAIRVGLLPPDVSVETAKSYFSRMWNRSKLITSERRFKDIVANYYAGAMRNEFAKAAERHLKSQARIEREVKDLRLSPDERTKTLDELDRKLQELDQKSGDLVARADELSDLRSQIRQARKDKNEAAETAAKEQRQRIEQQGGDALKAYLDERAALRSRRKSVDLGAAGLESRAERVLNQLADLDEANLRTLSRLIARGQKFERELQRLDPQEFEQRRSALRTAFAEQAAREDKAAERFRKLQEQIAKEQAKPPAKPQGFGPEVSELARTLSTPPYSDQVAIGQLYDEWAKTHPGVSLDDFKAQLIEAWRRDEVELVRLDLPQNLPDELRTRSATAAGDDRVHFVVKREAKPTVAPEVVRLQARVEAAIQAQARRSARMTGLTQRIETFDRFDPHAASRELQDINARLAAHASDITLSRGERAVQLQERLARLDPSRIDNRVKWLEQRRAGLERRFADRWETGRLGRGVDPLKPDEADFSDAARMIADDVFDTLAGRSTDGSVRPEFITVNTRGPMKDRTFNIPDRLVQDFLEDDVDLVGRRYARVMASDVELAGKFGRPDMRDQVVAIHEDYKRLRTDVTDEKELRRLDQAERADIADIEAMRDLLRGTYGKSAADSTFAAISRNARHFNYIRAMGGVVLSSLTDPIVIAMRHGLGAFMGGFGQLATNMKAVRMSVTEAQRAGLVLERVLGDRMATLTEIADPHTARGPIEKFLENMTNVASKWNGIRLWTDGMTAFSATLTQNRVLKGAADFGKIKKKERDYLAFLGIDQSMAERIAKEFAQHGQTVDGIRVAGTENWTDSIAKRVYRAAISKDTDSTIIRRSIADVPLIMHTPTGAAILQFKSFALASHQKILLRGLQEDRARLLGGLVALTAMGMAITWLKAAAGNHLDKLPDIGLNPGWWIGEGLDRSGVLAVFMEVANSVEKLVGVNPLKAPIRAVDASGALSQRILTRNKAAAFLGPSFGVFEDVATVLGIPMTTLMTGEEPRQAQRNAAQRLLPFNSYPGLQQFLRYIVNPPQ